MRKLNAKLNMSTARHFQTDGLTERVNETMQIVLRCYTVESRFEWVSHLTMLEFYFNCYINETSKHSPFEVTYGFQPASHDDRLLPLTGAPVAIAHRLNELANVREVVREFFARSMQRMAARSFRLAPTFVVGDFVFLLSKEILIHSQKCKHLRDQRPAPYQVIEKVGLKSYRLKLPQGCRLHPVFRCDLLSKA